MWEFAFDAYLLSFLLISIHCSLHYFAEHSIYNMGLAWMHIGGMRYLLLHNVDDLDPAMKYNYKQSLLAKKKSLLGLEIKVLGIMLALIFFYSYINY